MHGSKLNKKAKITYIRSYTHKIVSNFFSQHLEIAGSQIITVSPDKQVNFFVLKELFEEWQEEAKKFDSPYFDYKNEAVSRVLTSLANELSKNILIMRDKFEPLLQKALDATLLLTFDPAAFFRLEMDKISDGNRIKEFKAIGKYIKSYRPLFEQILANLERSKGADYSSTIEQTVINYQDATNEQVAITDSFSRTLTMNIQEDEDEEKWALERFSLLEEEENKGSRATKQREVRHNRPQTQYQNEEFEPFEEEIPDVVKESNGIKNINEQYSEEVDTINNRYERNEPQTAVAVNESQFPSNLKDSINLNQRYVCKRLVRRE